MSVWAGFANQLPKALENRRKSRLEMLDAFNEFKAANPYATAAEFQEFIDNASGGSNYLRGGMPGKEIIDEIAKRNAANLQQKNFERYASNIKSLGEMEGVLGAQLDDTLMSLSPDATEADYKAAADKLIESLPEGAGRSQFADRLRTSINPTRRSELVRDLLIKNQEDVTRFIRNSVGTDITAQQVSNRFGVPLDVAESLMTRGNELYQNEQAELRESRFDNALATGRRLIEADPDMDANTLATKIKEIYPTIDAAFAEDYFGNIAAEAIRQRNIEIDDRNRGILERAQQIADSVYTKYRSDDLTKIMARQGNKEDFQKMLHDELRSRLTDEQYQLYFKLGEGVTEAPMSFFDPEWNRMVEALQFQQRSDQENRRASNADKVLGINNTYIENNSERADDIFATTGDTGKAVEAILSGKYDMNNVFARVAADATMTLLQEHAQGPNKDIALRPDEIVTAIESNPQLMATTKPLQVAASEYAQRMSGITGAFDIETFDSYNKRFNEAIDEEFTTIEKALDDIMNSNLTLEQKKAAIAQVSAENKRYSVDTLTLHNSRRQKQNNWVTAGTGGWNQEAADASATVVENRRDDIAARIESLQTQIDADIANQANNTSTQNSPTNNSTFTSVLGTVTQIIPHDGDHTESTKLRALELLENTLRERVTRRNGAPNTGMQEPYDQYKMLQLYLNDVVIDNWGPDNTLVKDVLSQQPENWASFMQDPIAYMLADEDFLNKYPQFREPQ